MVEWSLNPVVAIVIAILIMFFGYFFGLFEGRSQGSKKREKEPAIERDLPPAAPPAQSDGIPILDLSMDPAGSLRLKLDGQKVDSSALSPEQRKRLIKILTQIRPWLEGRTPDAPPAAPQAAPASVPQPAPAPVSPPDSQAVALQKDDDQTPEAPPQSIVAQIDSILKSRLAGTPLAGMGIHLQESLEGGVNVWVGPKKFETVEDVEDDTIKAVIKAAITEWENKYTPGL